MMIDSFVEVDLSHLWNNPRKMRSSARTWFNEKSGRDLQVFYGILGLHMKPDRKSIPFVHLISGTCVIAELFPPP